MFDLINLIDKLMQRIYVQLVNLFILLQTSVLQFLLVASAIFPLVSQSLLCVYTGLGLNVITFV